VKVAGGKGGEGSKKLTLEEKANPTRFKSRGMGKFSKGRSQQFCGQEGETKSREKKSFEGGGKRSSDSRKC